MTRHAGGRQLVVIDISSMARIALDFRMRASQWIFRLVMVEMTRFPLALIMARFALCAVPSGMDVLDLMAIHTSHAHALVALANMTGGAGDSLVSALERKPGRVMVEFLDLAPRNLAVTILAFFTKVSLVRIDGLVTVEAPSRRLA